MPDAQIAALPTSSDVKMAARRIKPIAIETPSIESRHLNGVPHASPSARSGSRPRYSQLHHQMGQDLAELSATGRLQRVIGFLGDPPCPFGSVRL